MKIISRKEALALGLSKYYTGKPCIHGHLCERYTYPTQRTGKCVECMKVVNKRWRKKHPEKKRKSNKIWQENNEEKWKEVQRNGQRKYRKSLAGQLRDLCDHVFARLDIGKISKRKFELLNYTSDELFAHLLKNTDFKTLKEAWDNDYHIDHIVPVSYVVEYIEDKILAFQVVMDLDNLRLITAKENLEKADKIDLPIVQDTIKLLWDKYNLNEKGGSTAA